MQHSSTRPSQHSLKLLLVCVKVLNVLVCVCMCVVCVCLCVGLFLCLTLCGCVRVRASVSVCLSVCLSLSEFPFWGQSLCYMLFYGNTHTHTQIHTQTHTLKKSEFAAGGMLGSVLSSSGYQASNIVAWQDFLPLFTCARAHTHPPAHPPTHPPTYTVPAENLKMT